MYPVGIFVRTQRLCPADGFEWGGCGRKARFSAKFRLYRRGMLGSESLTAGLMLRKVSPTRSQEIK